MQELEDAIARLMRHGALCRYCKICRMIVIIAESNLGYEQCILCGATTEAHWVRVEAIALSTEPIPLIRPKRT